MGAQLKAARVAPPGRIIRRELEARGWTQKDLAHIMDRPEQTISQIVNGKKRITPETALQLAAAFGTSAELWLNLEASYQLHQAREEEEHPEISRKSRLYSLVPFTEICKRGWIRCIGTLEEMERELCDFLGIATPSDVPQLAVSFRQSDIGDPEVAGEIAWVKRVERLAQRQSVGEFDQERLRAAMPDLLGCAARVQDVSRVPAFLHDLGVHFVVVPHLPKTYLDGAAFKLNGHPVVALTLRYDRIDNFWFTLLHELAHIVADHAGGYLDNLDEESESPEEIEANRMARDWLIDREALTSFVGDVDPYFSESEIRYFARSQDRHPGIVLGRLHYEGLVPYQNLRKLLVPVEKHLKAWIDTAEPGT
jgi:HTH-type transcriptional regulator/antitoxin HigA